MKKAKIRASLVLEEEKGEKKKWGGKGEGKEIWAVAATQNPTAVATLEGVKQRWAATQKQQNPTSVTRLRLEADSGQSWITISIAVTKSMSLPA